MMRLFRRWMTLQSVVLLLLTVPVAVPVAVRSDERTPRERTSRQLLFDAVLWANPAALDKALASGVTLETRNDEGDTPLLWTVKYGSVRGEALLLQRGANLRARARNGASVWQVANQECVPALVRYGANVNERDVDGRTRLMKEASSGAGGLVRLLLDYGADPNLRDQRGQTALLMADSSDISLLLDHGADINARDNRGETVLMRWIWDGDNWYRRDAKAVTMLLKRGADVHRAHIHGSAVERAAKFLNVDIARAMLRLSPLTARERALLQHALLSDNLFGAATVGDAENARKWLRRGADPDIVLNDAEYEYDSQTPLMIAAQRPANAKADVVSPVVARREEARDVEVARVLLNRGADPDYQVESPTVGFGGDFALRYAAMSNKPRLVELLLQRGANPNLRAGTTALFAAVDSPAVTRALLHGGADPKVRIGMGTTVLLDAARNGRPDVVRMLLAYQADPNAGLWENRHFSYEAVSTPLIAAVHHSGRDKRTRADVEREGVAIARLLLRAGGRVNKRDQAGQTALLHAAAYDNVPLARLLLQAGASIELSDTKLQTPLMAACSGRYTGSTAASGGWLKPPSPDVAQWLLQHGANPNAGDEKGRTPLMAAALYDWRHNLGRGGPEELKHVPLYYLQNAAAAKRCLELLLSHGANPHLRDKSGRTAYDWAKSQANRDMTSLLKRAMERRLSPTVTASGVTNTRSITPRHHANFG